MFIVSELEDDVRVQPENLGLPTDEAVMQVLEKTFIDKVIKDLGLVVTIYDVLEVHEGNVYHSEGAAHYKVKFHVVVFHPLKEETLLGKVRDMDEKGIHVTLGFFKDVFIPKDFLPAPHAWHEAEQEWAWMSEDSPEPFFFQRNLEIRFKVHNVKFKSMPTLQEQQEQREADEQVEGTEERPYVPMQVQGKADGDGLGMIHWYQE